MQVKGTVYAVLDVKSGDSWKVQQFVVEYDKQYEKRILVEIFEGEKNQGAIERAGLYIGKPVIVDYDPMCRSWQGKWFGSNRAWRIVDDNSVPSTPTTLPPTR